MKRMCFILMANCFITVSFAQKKAIDFSAVANWPSINDQAISNDGKYAIYTINSEINGTKLIIQAVDNSFKKEISNADDAFITEDSKRAIYRISKDTLAILELRTNTLILKPNVISFKLPSSRNDEWIAYEYKTGELVLFNMLNKEERHFNSVKTFEFSDYGNVLLVQKSTKIDTATLYQVLWVDLADGKTHMIMQNKSLAENFVFDGHCQQLAFISKEKWKGEEINVLRYYKKGLDTAIIKVDRSSPGMKGVTISDNTFIQSTALSLPSFSFSGKKLFFSVQKIPAPLGPLKSIGGARVDVWNYKDGFLQSEQLIRLNYSNAYAAVIDINSGSRVICLRNGDIQSLQLPEKGDDKYFLVTSYKGDYIDALWRPSSRGNVSLVSLEDSSAMVIKNEVTSDNSSFSSSGKFVIWFDNAKHQYFTYNLASRAIKNITAQIPVPLYDDEDDHPNFHNTFGIADWLENDSAVLIYDRYDIWEIDPAGLKKPINITGNYGRRHNTILRIINFPKKNKSGINTSKSDESLMLSGFNRSTKNNGIFILRNGLKGNIEQRVMAPYAYFIPSTTFAYGNVLPNSFTKSSYSPIKARDTDVFIVKRMNGREFPNLYTTRNFKTFSPLTNLAPNKIYNWYTNELVKWEMFNGKYGEGILYKPENFDPQKKYPIIFLYYEKRADELNTFINPMLSDGEINIPYFVSNGYLIFVPDIYYEAGHPGRSAFNSVLSAADYLSRFSWVDKNKMGLDGFSFAGFETNYIVTHSKRFAAAVAGAGASDLISLTLGIFPGTGESKINDSENNQFRMGSNLWETPQFYIENSPVFNANRVTTPILIVHNKLDHNVPWEQGIEWFTALRRLGKKAWMLQYDEEPHPIYDNHNQLDYTIRLRQFFDYYLKGAPPAQWMTEGISAQMKGINDGLDLDTSGKQP